MSLVTVFNGANKELTQEFEDTFRVHAPMVYRTAYSVTRNAQDAEDIVQTLFLTVLRRGLPDGFRQNPGAYLYRSAVNLSLNAVRVRGRHVPIVEVDRPDESTAQGQAIDTERQLQLAEAIAQLNPRAVEVLVLRYEHDYSDAEIAKLLGKSRGSVALTLYRARARLKRLLRRSSKEGRHEA
jgi:RNA polymerase sigma-70 factor (ECF subfamily)